MTLAPALILASLSGGLLVLSFPWFDLSLLAWIGLVPSLLALNGASPVRGFVLGGVMSWSAFSGIFYWIWTVPAFNLLSYLLLAIYLSLYGGVFGLGVAWLRRCGLPLALCAPPLWVGLEYARSHASFLGVPWLLLGHSQSRHPWLIQICSFTGVFGLSFLLAFVNAAIADTLLTAFARRPLAGIRSVLCTLRPVSLAVAVALVGLTLLYGAMSLPGEFLSTSPDPKIAVVQGNIPQARKWVPGYREEILDRYERLTHGLASDHPALVIWPETAVPGDVQHSQPLRERLGRVANDVGSYLLVGSAATAKFSNQQLTGKLYNSLVLISPEGRIVGEYRKIHLLPFGEYAPLRELFNWPDAVATPRQDIVAGDQITLFTLDGVPFGATICWESLFPDLFREFVKRGARFMVNAGNEAWFGDTAAPRQFLAMTVFRAVENRVAIVRAANTGISAFIDPYGQITARLTGQDGKDVFTEGVLAADVPLAAGQTFYTVHGDVFAWLAIGGTLIMLSHGLLYARKLRLAARLQPATPIPGGKEDHAIPQPVQGGAGPWPVLPGSGNRPRGLRADRR